MAFSYNRKSFKKSYQFRKCARAYLRKGRYAPGDYCFFFFCCRLLHQARNVDINTIQARFKPRDTYWNDAQVEKFVHNYINSLTSPKYELSFCKSEQTCKAYRCCRS